MESVYDLYRRGSELLERGDYHAAIVPLSAARNAEPDKASIREALGRALFHARRYESAAIEFEAIASRAPTNHYALFCLGRAMQLLGRHREACKPLALACSLAPEREDYRRYRDRARRQRHKRDDRALRCYAQPTAFEPACERRLQYREWAPARFFCVRSPACTPAGGGPTTPT
jgi:tetratricopeptide (TPR) repeat protein